MADVCIALDAMGGDNGPIVVVPAALKALSANPNLKLILVGIVEQIESHLRANKGLNHPRLSIVHADEVVGMDEPPAVALRSKRDSSMRVEINLVKEGKARACVSAGNTGALMAIARFVLKTIPGVDRPAIVNSLPTQKGHVYVLDLGANVDCEAEHLFQFAVMGSVLATAVDGNPHPTIGLLNVGQEAIKGSEQVKKAAELLSQLDKRHINYVGFVEGDDIFKGTADVVVCDGFVGNNVLKSLEGLIKMALTFAKKEFTRNWYNRLAAAISLPVLRSLKKQLDPGRYNGASLIGLKGIVIKSHGKADVFAFANAINVATHEVENNVPLRIESRVSAVLQHKSEIIESGNRESREIEKNTDLTNKPINIGNPTEL